MVIKFAFGNVFSFKEKQVVSFQPEGLKELPEHLHEPLLSEPSEPLLKSMAIYGHNSHGKSNLIKALLFFRDFVTASFSLPDRFYIEPFLLNTSTLNEPTFFEIQFYIKDTKYRYGFEIKGNVITGEWLHYTLPNIRENYLFLRVGQEFIFSKNWNKENGNKIDVQSIPFAKPSVLLLSILNAQALAPINEITKKISEIVIIENINSDVIEKAVSIYSDDDYQDSILNFIRKADLGFTSIFDKIEKKLKETKFERGILNMWYDEQIRDFQLYSIHDIYNEKFEKIQTTRFELFKKESEGSIKFFIIVCLLLYALKNNLLICIDELDSKLHSELLQLLIREYHNPNVNLSTAQLIFTTHNTVLLDKQLRRDQFLVIEKDEYGQSSVRKMHTKETPIRIDSSMEKEYRKGKLGGVSKKVNRDVNQGKLFD